MVLAALSALFPTLVFGYFLAGFLVPTSAALPVTFFQVTLAAWGLLALSRIVLARKLRPVEQTTVRFWSFAPLATLLVALTVGATPLLLLHALGVQLGVSALRALVVTLLLSSALVVTALWRRLRRSFPSIPSVGAA